MAEERKRIEWIDIAKGIAIIFVIFGHTIQSGTTAYGMVFSFHMPIFFILAGYTFRTKAWKTLLPSSAKRLLLPFLICFAIRSATSTYIDHSPSALGLELLFSWAYIPYEHVTDLTIQHIGALWFLLCLFIARIYLNAIVKLFDRCRMPVIGQLVIVLALSYVGVWLGRHFLIPLDLDIALTATMFMYLGYLLRQMSLTDLLTKWWVAIIMLVVWYFAQDFSYLEMGTRHYWHYPVAVIAACAATLVIIKVAMLIELLGQHGGPVGRGIKSYFAFMGRKSMLVFCLHTIEAVNITWTELPWLAGLPHHTAIAFVVRLVALSLVAALTLLA